MLDYLKYVLKEFTVIIAYRIYTVYTFKKCAIPFKQTFI